jgi:hypothetical protein
METQKANVDALEVTALIIEVKITGLAESALGKHPALAITNVGTGAFRNIHHFHH